MCCESPYSGVRAEKVPPKVVLRTILTHSSCGADATKWEARRAKFLELWNGSCCLKTPMVGVKEELQYFGLDECPSLDSQFFQILIMCNAFCTWRHWRADFVSRTQHSNDMAHTEEFIASVDFLDSHIKHGEISLKISMMRDLTCPVFPAVGKGRASKKLINHLFS